MTPKDDADDLDPYGELSGTMNCPHCGAMLHEDCQLCPQCEMYFTEEEVATRQRHPWWILVAAFLCILIVIGWVIGGF